MAEIPAGWPCASLPAVPPSVTDRQANPTAEGVLPQVLALTPRGPAWGTDEAGGGRDASPVMRAFWRAIAGWVADANKREFDLATQALPSAITWSIDDWEREYGLPDLCTTGEGGTEARVAAVRARFAATGGQSPAYFVCLAKSAGYDISIEEPTQFMVDVSEVTDGDLRETWFTIDGGEIDATPLEGLSFGADVEADELAGESIDAGFRVDQGEIDTTPLEDFDTNPNGSTWKFWVVHPVGSTETFFRIDEGEVEADPLEGFVPLLDLECLLRRDSPPHTQLVFRYGA